jgi:hypothetical protein
MTDDLVKRLRVSSDGYYGGVHLQLTEAADRIEFLEAGLLKVHMLAESQTRNSWDYHAKYYRISTSALEGKDD